MTRHSIRQGIHRARINAAAVNPYEVAVAISFLLIGLAILIIPPLTYPTSITALFHANSMRAVWGICVALSGALKTAGILAAKTNWRKAGLLLIAGVSAVFVLAIIYAGNVAFVFTGGIFIAICLASLAMYRRLG